MKRRTFKTAFGTSWSEVFFSSSLISHSHWRSDLGCSALLAFWKLIQAERFSMIWTLFQNTFIPIRRSSEKIIFFTCSITVFAVTKGIVQLACKSRVTGGRDTLCIGGLDVFTDSSPWRIVHGLSSPSMSECCSQGREGHGKLPGRFTCLGSVVEWAYVPSTGGLWSCELCGYSNCCCFM